MILLFCQSFILFPGKTQKTQSLLPKQMLTWLIRQYWRLQFMLLRQSSSDCAPFSQSTLSKPVLAHQKHTLCQYPRRYHTFGIGPNFECRANVFLVDEERIELSSNVFSVQIITQHFYLSLCICIVKTTLRSHVVVPTAFILFTVECLGHQILSIGVEYYYSSDSPILPQALPLAMHINYL